MDIESVDIAAPEGRLQGRRLGSGTRAAVVAPPHPLYGGSIDNPVVDQLCAALVDTGHTVLAFNWRGVGASGGRPSGSLDDAVEDFRAACAWWAGQGAAVHGLGGYSYGAITALHVAAGLAQKVSLSLVAPPAAMLEGVPASALAHPVRTVVGDCDGFAPVDEVRATLAAAGAAAPVVLSGCDHFFAGAGADAIRAALASP